VMTKKQQLIEHLAAACNQPAQAYHVGTAILPWADYVAELQKAIHDPEISHEFVDRVESLLNAPAITW
jgi:hypothetical protein